MQIVAGYICLNCADVDLARKGVDPAHPHDGPAKAQSAAPAHGPAVTLSGAAAQVAPGPGAEAPRPYAPGANVDLRA